VNWLLNDHNVLFCPGLFRIGSLPCLFSLRDLCESFEHLAEQVTVVLSVIFQETLNTQVRLAGETAQLLHVVFVSMLVRAEEAQSLTTVQAS